jgi:hypothetical protein
MRHGFSANHDKARLRTSQIAEETTVEIGNDALPMFDPSSCDSCSPKIDHHFLQTNISLHQMSALQNISSVSFNTLNYWDEHWKTAFQWSVAIRQIHDTLNSQPIY